MTICLNDNKTLSNNKKITKLTAKTAEYRFIFAIINMLKKEKKLYQLHVREYKYFHSSKSILLKTIF